MDLPPFLDHLLARQIQADPRPRCPCAAQHGGTGRYVFLSPDGGHYRRSNYGRRVFRPACDGRHEPGTGRPTRLVIADATTWPGIPLAAWPAAQPGKQPHCSPPRGRGIQAIPEDTPLTCWLPIQPGLTTHGLRHSHKTWMAEDGIPEILAEQRLGHQVPGMRGLYAHVSDPDARRAQGRAPGPLGRLPARPRCDQPALTGPAARRTAGPVSRQRPASSAT